ncbi:MAG TPA: TolC family protein [Terracidiphilus sp.]|nr:TolC family protein [Terracidiphilus sp.]
MNRVLRRAVWLVIFGCLTGSGAVAQEPLTLKQAIDLALKQNPEEAEAHAAVDESRADTAQARTALLPQFNFTEDMTRGDDPVYVFGTRLRQQQFTQADFAINALNRPQPAGNFSTRISGGWQVFDSLRTERLIRGAALIEKSAQSQAGAIDQKTVFGVVAAYQQVLYAEREIDTAQHDEKTAEALLESVDEHVKAGLAVESDRMSAQVNLAACKQSLIAAEGDRELAWAQLRMATGAPDLAETRLAPLETHDFPQGDLQQELKTAATGRKDLAAMGLAGQAQGAAASAARFNYGPHVNAYGNLENDAASFGGANGTNWVAGVRISIDLLPLSKHAQLEHEKAASARVNAELESYRQRVRVEVSQAHIQLETARQSMETARAAIDQATESLRIIRNRYQAGLATITDLLRAEDAERQSQTSYWRAVYGNTMAYAQLLFATGTLTPETAEDLQ